jgi:hypothetical protein
MANSAVDACFCPRQIAAQYFFRYVTIFPVCLLYAVAYIFMDIADKDSVTVRKSSVLGYQSILIKNGY